LPAAADAICRPGIEVHFKVGRGYSRDVMDKQLPAKNVKLRLPSGAPILLSSVTGLTRFATVFDVMDSKIGQKSYVEIFPRQRAKLRGNFIRNKQS
jgi:hypothetical protein